MNTSYGPTAMQQAQFKMAKESLAELQAELKPITEQLLPAIEQQMQAAGAPYIMGQPDNNEK